MNIINNAADAMRAIGDRKRVLRVKSRVLKSNEVIGDCRSIIEDHDGTISVMPGIPHGSVFRVVLPGISNYAR